MIPHRAWRSMSRVSTLVVLATFLLGAGIPLSSYLLNQGTFTPWGQTDVALPDSDYVFLAADYAGRAVRLTGALTADRNSTVPLEKGITYEITNATTGGHNVLFGGASGARVTIAASTTQPVSVHCPDGANFYLMGGAGGSGFDAASGIPAVDITGVIGVTQGGTGLDAACPPGTFLSGDGGVDYCKTIAAGELPTITLTGFVTGAASGGSIATSLAANQTPTFATVTGRSGTRYADSGSSTLEIPSPCSGFGTTGNGPVDSCTLTATFTDATTWVNLFTTGFAIANRTSGTFDVEYSITDQTDAPDAGPVDVQVGQYRFTATSSNGGGITLFDEIGGGASATSLTLTAAPTSRSYISGVAGSVVPSCRVQVTGTYIQPQCQGRSGKTDIGQFTMQQARSLQ